MTITRNPFDTGGYSLAEMTQAINILPDIHSRLAQIGLFRFQGVTQRSVIIEQFEGILSLLPTVPLVRGYDTRLAPVQFHRGLINVTSNALVEEPHRLLVGTVDEIAFTTPVEGGSANCEITIANSSRELTRGLTAKYSDETMRIMVPGEAFFRYADISGEVTVRWGG